MGEMLPYYNVGKAQSSSGEALLPHRAGGQSLKLLELPLKNQYHQQSLSESW